MPIVRIHDLWGSEQVCSIDRADDELFFGRSDSNGLVLRGQGISRRHGRLYRDHEGRWWVEDLSSTNGVFVEGRRVKRECLSDGASMVIGELTLTFSYDASPARSTVVMGERPDHLITLERSASSLGPVQRHRLEALCEMARRLMARRRVAELVAATSHMLASDLSASVIVFGLTREPEKEPDSLIVWPEGLADNEVVLSRSVLQRTIAARRAVLITETAVDADLARAHSVVKAGIRSAMCVPLTAGDEVTGFLYLDSRQSGVRYGESDLEFAGAIAAMVGVAIEKAKLQQVELVQQRMAAELGAARQLQQSILPTEWPVLPGWDVYGHHTTCYEIGGDYYDAIVDAAGRLWLVVADACGKGTPAALLASILHAGVHALVSHCDSPQELLKELNGLLLRRELDTAFVTCLVCLISPDSGRALVGSAGHPPPVYVDPGSDAHCIPLKPDVPLGITSEARYEDCEWSCPDSGTALLLYTDGVSDAFNAEREQFGDQRLLGLLSRRPTETARQLVTIVRQSVEEFAGDQDTVDDLTLLACRRC